MVELNTKKLSDSGKDITNLSKELYEEFDTLFTMLANLQKSGVWVGDAATQFIKKSQEDRAQYMKVRTSILKYGSVLLNAASSYEIQINSLKR